MQTGERVVDEMVCFSLYAAARATTQAYRTLLGPWDLTYPQYLVLVVLWGAGDAGAAAGGVSVGSLGDRLELDSGTLSPLLRRMEGAGLVTRTRSADDERVVTVDLAPRGRAMRQELAHIPSCIAGGMGLDVDGAHELIGVLHRLTDGMQQTTADARTSTAASPTQTTGSAASPTQTTESAASPTQTTESAASPWTGTTTGADPRPAT